MKRVKHDMSTRPERAKRLRSFAESLVSTTSLRDAAGLLDVSVGALRNLIDGSTPQEDTLRRMEAAAKGRGYVQWEAADGEVPRVNGISPAAQMELDSYWLNELRAIRASGDPEIIQTLHRESVASAISRIAGLVDARYREVAERASEARARAAEAWARATEKAEGNAERRMEELGGVKTIPREAFGETEKDLGRRNAGGA